MPDKQTSPLSAHREIDRFLEAVEQAPRPFSGQGRGRLIFAMDATASRQPTWDQACRLQGDMFTRTRALGSLDVQLCFYRGYDEFRVSPWHGNAPGLLRAMSAVHCLGGHTQIEKVLRHALREHARQPVQALVLIGDCVEEPIDDLCALAGELGLQGIPLFIFQEGQEPTARVGFKQMARLSQGAHCHFDSGSPEQLSALLTAVATYATGGFKALQKLSTGTPLVSQLSHQLQAPKP